MDATAPPEPKPVSIDIDRHLAEKARIKAEQAKQRPEMLRCLNPAYAAKREAEKAYYRWEIQAEWMESDDGELSITESTQTVVAQNEQDAWAMFCDKLQRYPSPRNTTRTITRGRKVAMSEVEIGGTSETGELPRKTIGPKAKQKRV